MRRFAMTCAATLCLVVWLATPLMSVAHAVMVEHTYCAEHERLEEGAAHHDVGQHDLGIVVRTAFSSVKPDRSGASQVAHEGCAFSEQFTLEDPLVLPSDLIVEPVLASDVFLMVASLRAFTETVPLLHIAPKSSPPLLA